MHLIQKNGIVLRQLDRFEVALVQRFCCRPAIDRALVYRLLREVQARMAVRERSERVFLVQAAGNASHLAGCPLPACPSQGMSGKLLW